VALRQAEHGVAAQRTFRFRHTGNRQAKFHEARQVLGLTINYQRQFKELADRLAREPITAQRLERSVLRRLWMIDEQMGKQARQNRERMIGAVLDTFAGRGAAGDTTGNSPHSKWGAWNAVREELDYFEPVAQDHAFVITRSAACPPGRRRPSAPCVWATSRCSPQRTRLLLW
jgi:hypothetical protein